jgi:hypothetical protein
MLMPFGSAFTVHNLGIDILHLPTIYLVSGLFTVFIGRWSAGPATLSASTPPSRSAAPRPLSWC